MSELERDALQNITLRSKREKDELRAENERLREDLRLAVMSDSEECKLLTAEIERLNNIVIRGLAGVELSEENDRLIVEIERLTMELRAHRQDNGAVIAGLQNEIRRLRAVIVRAKDALLDGQSTQWVHDLLVAELHRRALEGK